jgi:hypothetical protein
MVKILIRSTNLLRPTAAGSVAKCETELILCEKHAEATAQAVSWKTLMDEMIILCVRWYLLFTQLAGSGRNVSLLECDEIIAGRRRSFWSATLAKSNGRRSGTQACRW